MFSRRKFLADAVWLATLPTAVHMFATTPAFSGSTSDNDSLTAAMDELIPAVEHMPSASLAGGREYLQYLRWQYPDVDRDLRRFLEVLRHVSTHDLGSEFPKLQQDRRVRTLAAIEQNEPLLFKKFLSYVYESYYTSPNVISLITCPTTPFSSEDELSLLSPVRRLAHLRRETR